MAVPVRSFEGSKSRLEHRLSPQARNRLTLTLAHRTVSTAVATGLRTAVVTADPVVRAWAASAGAEAIDEPGDRGLDGAAAAVMYWAAIRGHAWMVLHADLPFLSAGDITHAAARRPHRGFVIAPSYDGGTPLLGGPSDPGTTRPIDTSYGPGSFHRHLAAVSHLPHTVVCTTGLALDVDSASDFDTMSTLDGGDWLAELA